MSVKKYKKQKFTNEQIADTFGKKACNLSATAIALGVDRTTLYNWRNEDEKLNALMAEKEESVLDACESKLIQHIDEGDLSALIFFLKTKGKKRGYVERVEQELTSNPFLELMKSLPDGEEED